MNISPILNIAEICAQMGINHAVICPGSRSAPITLGFAHHPKINCKIINDERSAAFMAMGMALQLQETVALVCTSGTAVLNFAPAIAEAYYQQIPLLVLTADRPPELIDQQDGQCLRQFEIYKNYIKKSLQTPDNLENENDVSAFYKIIEEAINISKSSPCSPVHVNIPIREPFYPKEKFDYDLSSFKPQKIEPEKRKIDFSTLINKIKSSKKTLFIAGQQNKNAVLENHIKALTNLNFPVIADINSNFCGIENVIQSEDFIFQKPLENLHPEIIVTFGNSILSKKLKTYFRENKVEHWHIAETIPVPDFFFQLKGNYLCTPLQFFENAIEQLNPVDKNYFNLWMNAEQNIKSAQEKLMKNVVFSEPSALYQIIEKLPQNSHIHLANSMAVRWANMLGVSAKKQFTIQSNRGVSGIDGCTSTALGYSIFSAEQNFLITGDIAFFYDRNAFWNDYIPQNLKIILLNNHSGGIFNIIPGPSNIKESLNYFTSNQKLNAQKLAEEFGLEYYFSDNKNSLSEKLNAFISSNKCCILEIETDNGTNKKVFEEMKNLS